ncbi:DUF4402 domain-containing protein [Christiangramia echinicola]|uniref:DUF4402 domain-containing protein n=1 Tax=Christiangramia echinicola TaxID=279359 RepID=A0A1H1RYA0_9FLAO|nr:DUF4402 domain-containing protein [Christiangramia echinicola]SDS40687.1 protein of unknown function [Christiangramia echinicola]
MIKPVKSRGLIYFRKLYLGMIFMIFSFQVASQENPPIPIEVEVRTARFLDFGAFTTGVGTGQLHISYDSTPTPTGDVYMINGRVVTSALFDVYANPGTIINIMPASPNFILYGSDGGQMTVSIADSDYSTGSTFITTANADMPNEVYVGGTLDVSSIDSANPAGKYTGTIIINFIQE